MCSKLPIISIQNLNWLCYIFFRNNVLLFVSLHNMKILMILLLPAFLLGQVIGKEKLEFNRDIRPILVWMPVFIAMVLMKKERKGGLRLDLESHAYKAGKSGFEAIIRGNSKDSEIITRIHLHEDDSEHMPPLKVESH